MMTFHQALTFCLSAEFSYSPLNSFVILLLKFLPYQKLISTLFPSPFYSLTFEEKGALPTYTSIPCAKIGLCDLNDLGRNSQIC